MRDLSHDLGGILGSSGVREQFLLKEEQFSSIVAYMSDSQMAQIYIIIRDFLFLFSHAIHIFNFVLIRSNYINRGMSTRI